MSIDVRPFGHRDRAWAYALLFPNGTPSRIASKGELFDPMALEGFVAWKDGKRIGLVTYRKDGDEYEILTLDSEVENLGAGTALIEAVKDAVRARGCSRVWLNTTNANTHALGFYQRRGFVIRDVRLGMVDRERGTIKPEIPVAEDGIPIRDEIELVLEL